MTVGDAFASPAAQPLVSIVTPTRDRAPLLQWTLRSVQAQAYPNIEHIVMDGGSVDGTVELLRQYEEIYRMRWVSKQDAGLYPAINQGLGGARGEILAYLNSDDLYFPWTIEAVVQAFNRHPEVGVVFGDALSVDDETGRQVFYWMPPFDLDFIRRTGFLAQPAVFWRRSVYEDIGPFDESLKYVADCDFWMRAGKRHRFHKLNEFLAIERNHPGTLRESTDGAVWAEVTKVRSRYVTLSGLGHRLRMVRHGLRRRFWTRLYSLGIVVQTTAPAALRGRRWARYAAAAGRDLIRRRIVLRTVPIVGRFVRGDLLRASRRWLEPGAPS